MNDQPEISHLLSATTYSKPYGQTVQVFDAPSKLVPAGQATQVLPFQTGKANGH